MSLYWIKNVTPWRLAIAARPRGGDWLSDEVRRLQNSGVQILVSMLTKSEIAELGLVHEPEECRSCEITYLNFPIQDRSVPESRVEFKNFLAQLTGELGSGKALAVHCRVGIGRSSLLICALLVQFGVTNSEAWSMIQ
jgi:protein-tyrosine phosphatase